MGTGAIRKFPRSIKIVKNAEKSALHLLLIDYGLKIENAASRAVFNSRSRRVERFLGRNFGVGRVGSSRGY